MMFCLPIRHVFWRMLKLIFFEIVSAYFVMLDVTVPRAPIIIGIICTCCKFRHLFISISRGLYFLSFWLFFLRRFGRVVRKYQWLGIFFRFDCVRWCLVDCVEYYYYLVCLFYVYLDNSPCIEYSTREILNCYTYNLTRCWWS